MIEEVDPTSIEEEGVRQVVIKLMNVVDKQNGIIAEQAAEMQRLRDEINRRVWGTRQAQDQRQQSGCGSFLGKRTSAVQAPKQGQQTEPDPHRSGSGAQDREGAPA